MAQPTASGHRFPFSAGQTQTGRLHQEKLLHTVPHPFVSLFDSFILLNPGEKSKQTGVPCKFSSHRKTVCAGVSAFCSQRQHIVPIRPTGRPVPVSAPLFSPAVSRKTRARPLSGAARGLCRPTKTGGISSAGSALLSFIRGSGTARRPLPCARSR